MNDHKKTFRDAMTWADLTIIGIQFPVAIGLGYLWGSWLDRHLGTAPWLMIIFSLFGIAAGFINLFRISARAGVEEARQARKEQERERSGGGG